MVYLIVQSLFADYAAPKSVTRSTISIEACQGKVAHVAKYSKCQDFSLKILFGAATRAANISTHEICTLTVAGIALGLLGIRPNFQKSGTGVRESNMELGINIQKADYPAVPFKKRDVWKRVDRWRSSPVYIKYCLSRKREKVRLTGRAWREKEGAACEWRPSLLVV